MGIYETRSYRKCKSPEDSIKYCTKEESREHGPYEEGTRPTWNIKGQKLKNLEIINTPLTQLIEEDKIHIRDYEKIRKAINLYKLDKASEKENQILIYG